MSYISRRLPVDKKGNPVRDEDSTTYVGRIENAEEFGPEIYAEARRRGLQRAQNMFPIIGDGALWIWNIVDEHFYGATQIFDLFMQGSIIGGYAGAFGRSKKDS